MKIRVGCELIYSCPQPTPMILMLNIHFTRVSDILVPDHLVISPSVPIRAYRDSFGNWCSRIVAPLGETSIRIDALVNDSGLPDPVAECTIIYPAMRRDLVAARRSAGDLRARYLRVRPRCARSHSFRN